MRAFATLTLVMVAASSSAQHPAQHEHAAPEKLGRVHFATSCSTEVGAAFDRAVALLHSFSFSTAKQAFDGVLAKDPSCAMAHWGVAMSVLGQPVRGLRSAKALEGGQAAASAAQSTGTPTPRERDYIAAVAELYKAHPTVDQRTRMLAYESAMEQVSANIPKTRGGGVLRARRRSDGAPTDKTYAQQLKAAAILEQLFAANRSIPGWRTTSSKRSITRRWQRERSRRRAGTRRSRPPRRTRSTCPLTPSRASVIGGSRSSRTPRRLGPPCATAPSPRRCTRWITRPTPISRLDRTRRRGA